MPTVIMGSARDIVEHCRVPRFFFFDAPLGNPCGTPGDRQMQDRNVRAAVGLLAAAVAAETTLVADESWGAEDWKDRYMAVTDENREALARKGEELRARRAERVSRTF